MPAGLSNRCSGFRILRGRRLFLVKPPKTPNFAALYGPVVEWILRKSPELKIQVRFLTGPLEHPPSLIIKVVIFVLFGFWKCCFKP